MRTLVPTDREIIAATVEMHANAEPAVKMLHGWQSPRRFNWACHAESNAFIELG